MPDTKDWKNAAKGLYVAHDRAARVELCRHLIIGKQLASVAALVLPIKIPVLGYQAKVKSGRGNCCPFLNAKTDETILV